MNSLPIEKRVKTREIKFRSWDPKYKVMRYGGVFMTGNLRFSYYHPEEQGIEVGDSHRFLQNVMQFTGMFDKNGTEIYESDYLDFNGLVYEVVFKDGCWTAMCLTTGPNPDGSESKRPDDVVSNLSSISVIDGNIYEDTELLEQRLVEDSHV